jgi:hypothetical protein
MKTAEEAAKEFLIKLALVFDLSTCGREVTDLVINSFIKGFESGKAEGFESRQGEVDALKAELLQVYSDWKKAIETATNSRDSCHSPKQ